MQEQNSNQPPPLRIAGPPPLKRRRRKTPWILGGAAVLAVLVLGLVMLGRTINQRWGDLPEPPDETGFERYTASVPDEANAYVLYLRAANATTLDDTFFDRFYEETYEEALTSTLLNELRTAHAESLDWYANALAAQDALAPRDASLENYPIPDGLHTSDFDDLMYLYLNQRFYQGEQRAALDECLDYAFLGTRLMEARGPYIVYQEGTYLTETALGSFSTLVVRSDLGNDEIAAFAERLGALRDDGHALRDSLVETYHAILGTIEAAIDPGYDDVFGENSRLGQILENQNRASMYNWQPNRTRALLLDILRPLAESAHDAYAGMPHQVVPKWENPGPQDVLEFLKPNGIGTFLSRYYLSDLAYTLRTKCGHNTHVALAEAACALKMYHNDHGTLPDSLDGLVPVYHEAVPRDDFSGDDLRYNREQAFVYSVGWDLIDAGGESDIEDDLKEIALDVSPLAQLSAEADDLVGEPVGEIDAVVDSGASAPGPA